jgi:hypothetical protein
VKLFRFLYLNSYALLLIILGAGVLLIPLFKISPWFLALQIPGAVKILAFSLGLFSTWPEKKRMMVLLINKNKREFRPESFKIYMQSPCSRLLVKSVLLELDKKRNYRELLIYKPSLLAEIRKNLAPVKTSVYINADYL